MLVLPNYAKNYAGTNDSSLSGKTGRRCVLARKECDFDGKPSRFGKENNFGKFGDHNINKDHRCSFSSASKTQHWFGAKYDE